jgi:ribosomal 50S subunit-recycling heat shock protein
MRDSGIVRAAEDVEPGERLSLRVAEAEIEAAVAAVRALRRA